MTEIDSTTTIDAAVRIVNLLYVTEYDRFASCTCCGDDIEHGQTGAHVKIQTGDEESLEWMHQDCAETMEGDILIQAAPPPPGQNAAA